MGNQAKIEQARPERHYQLYDRVLWVDGGRTEASAETCEVFGFEWSDGTNVAGRPSVRYEGWFYHVRVECDEKEWIVPEFKLARA